MTIYEYQMLNKSEAENAKLQLENDKLRFDIEQLKQRITTQKQTIGAYRDESREWHEVADRLDADNAKLRELVRGLYWCTEGPDGPRVDCERCPLGAVEGKPLELTCEKMMRELEIEVAE